MSIVEKGTTHAIVKFLTAKPAFETIKTKRTVCKILSGLIAAIITILVVAFLLVVFGYIFDEVLKIKGKIMAWLFIAWLYIGYKIFRWIFCLINELGLKRIYRTYIDMYAEEIITSVEVSKEQLESFREDCIKWL